MKGKRFTEEQIIAVLKEHEAGARISDLVRKHNVSEQSIYRWRSKYGGMEVSDTNPHISPILPYSGKQAVYR